MWSKDVSYGVDCHIHESVVFEGTVKIGNNVTIHPSCVIGGQGSSADLVDGIYQVRKVEDATVIEDGVTILNSTSIQAGAKIGRGSILGPRANVGHHAKIGESVRMHVNSYCGGRSILGKRVVVHPGASIANKVTVGEFSRIGMNAVVEKDIPPSRVYFGVPARSQGEQRIRGDMMRKLLEEYKTKTGNI